MDAAVTSMRLAVPGSAALAVLLAGACSPPARTPATHEDPTYVRRLNELRAALEEVPMSVDTLGAETTVRTPVCGSPAGQVLIGNNLVSLEATNCWRCDLASERDADIDPEVIDAVGIAFARYPVSFLRASRIERIALCRVVEREGEPAGTDPERVAGTVDLQARRILFSLEGFIGSDYDPMSPFTGEDILHHELFHLLEVALTPDLALDDPEWRLLNAVDFTYHGQGQPLQPGPGFVNDYATTNEQEDRASTFEFMMARPGELCAKAAKDPVVAAKAKLIWDRVAGAVGDDFLRRRVDCLTYRPAEEEQTLHLGARTTVVPVRR